ncbi:unnamed protein product [Prorocentrum cordatum]|uniref:Uncharacterized protein n=1 Tax=Prorocentrum cordatum TaxID=2364126 RepID=A0ABN9U3D2_9DINO|nr:unnamed protein product [Polarella glacialis]
MARFLLQLVAWLCLGSHVAGQVEEVGIAGAGETEAPQSNDAIDIQKQVALVNATRPKSNDAIDIQKQVALVNATGPKSNDAIDIQKQVALVRACEPKSNDAIDIQKQVALVNATGPKSNDAIDIQKQVALVNTTGPKVNAVNRADEGANYPTPAHGLDVRRLTATFLAGLFRGRHLPGRLRANLRRCGMRDSFRIRGAQLRPRPEHKRRDHWHVGLMVLWGRRAQRPR